MSNSTLFTWKLSKLFDDKTVDIFKGSFGPNWEFHLEQELKTRDPKYLFIDEFPENFQEKRIRQVADIVLINKDSFLHGNSLKNKNVKKTLYSWRPELEIIDIMNEYPSWEIHTKSCDGGACITGVGDVRFIRDSYGERLESWKKAVKELKQHLADSPFGGHLCYSCFEEQIKQEDFVIPRPELKRQTATLIRRSENYPVICARCEKKDIVHIDF